jgi:hypothetical protein
MKPFTLISSLASLAALSLFMVEKEQKKKGQESLNGQSSGSWEAFSSRGSDSAKKVIRTSSRSAPRASFAQIESIQSHSPEVLGQLREVREFSHRRIEQLTHLLNLTAEQRRAAYPLVARTSPAFNEDILINGQYTSALDEEGLLGGLDSILDSNQVEALASEESDRLEWWEDLVAELEFELDEDLSAGNAVNTENPVVTERVDEQAGSNLFGN